MKKTSVSMLAILAGLHISAQTNIVKVAGKLYYTTVHVRDTVSGNSFTETSILYFGNRESLFRSYDYLQAIANTQKMESEGRTTFGMVMGRGTSSRYYTNLTSNEITRVHAYGMSSNIFSKPIYSMPEKMDKINWKIERATKKIGDYTCQKAAGICRGRKYIAWFAADIPYSFGPWKPNGLPGLILEAEDDRHQVLFRFARIEYPGSADEYLEVVKNATITTEAAFERMRESSVNLKEAPTGMSIAGGLVDAQGRPVAPPTRDKRLIANPMDLISKLPRLDMQ